VNVQKLYAKRREGREVKKGVYEEEYRTSADEAEGDFFIFPEQSHEIFE
jgi:hypothetical protein